MNPKRKKILFILPTLTAGGAERVISFVAQNIDKSKFESTLLIVGHKEDAVYSVEEIPLIFLEKSRVLNATTNIFWFLLKYRPDVVLSSIGHLNTLMGLLSGFFPKTKLIVREASVISAMSDAKKENKEIPKKKYFLNFLASLRAKLGDLSLKWIDVVICQSKDMASDFINIFNLPEEKVVIINNPITQIYPLKTETDKTDIPRFITVGRLSKEKGHLRILNLLTKLNFDFRYTIIGTGPEKDSIFERMEKLGLSEKVNYIPYTEEVLKHISQHDLFLQGSYVEGFPNTVLESCLVGTPVLAFNVPGGTKEIITHGENGYLVETEKEYLHYLNNRLNLAPEQIRKSVEDRFNKSKILRQFEALFN
ncbi:glycosyltransferase [Hyunsoonleella rubra]|uniref:Glycosyltransferase n=1 Tax=Hyunsoonleella rubra TaxID=1737062 RepID=A0ABW5TCY8_9FLAO